MDEADLSRLNHPKDGRPFEIVGSEVVGKAGPFAVRRDVIRFPDGAQTPYIIVVNPDSSFVVPYFENGDTLLVRQWRHAWDESSWEVPAGTAEEGEGPLECARRELAEETGLVAKRYTSLGSIHGAAFLTGRAHLFLAEEITESDRSPEAYEQDMQLMRLPFAEALESALSGEIAHSGSVTALSRAARALKLS